VCCVSGKVSPNGPVAQELDLASAKKFNDSISSCEINN
jgi:hypothetical protein